MEVKIEKLVFGGWGLGRLQGKVVFVPYVLPGELVKIEITEERTDYALARLIDILQPSEQRITPFCPYFGQCGGCDYQHIPYDLQLDFKKEQLIEVLKRNCGLDITDICQPILSSKEIEYRNRLKLRLKRDGYEIKLGAYHKNSRRFVPIEDCPIAESLIRQIIPQLKHTLTHHLALAERLISVELFSSQDEQKAFIVFQTLVETNPKQLRRLAETLLTNIAFLKDVLYEHAGLTYPRSLLDKGYTQSGLRFKITDSLEIIRYPGTFFQVNTTGNRHLIKSVINLFNPQKEDRILELYAGNGNLSLPLALRAKRLVGLESNSLAVKNANYNAQLNHIKNAIFRRVNVETELEEFLKEDNNFNALLLDPPRVGCLRSLKSCLGVIKPPKIIYVSCHPATLARDLKFLLKNGYRVEKFQPIDMFPHTHHIEVVTELTLS